MFSLPLALGVLTVVYVPDDNQKGADDVYQY
jgi:hypothetical protein